jgi:hypothetical protein
MDNPTATVDALTGELAGALGFGDLLAFTDEPLLQVAVAVERLGRRVDALRVATAAEIADRSRAELGAGGMAARKGCRSAVELLERLTRASVESVQKRMKVGIATRARLSIAGERMPAPFPHLAEALAAGEVGLDSSHAIVRALSQVSPGSAGAAAIGAAESELVAAATGTGPDTPVACTAGETRIQADTWRLLLDQDGTEPAEEKAMRIRGFGFGRLRDGIVPVHGGLLPDVAAKFQAVFDACMSPRTGPAFMSAEELAAHDLAQDPRTRDQQRHDILAGVIDMAARSGKIPTIGGAAPTVLVSVRQQDLEAGRGVGFIGEAPVSMRAVKQFACTGGIQHVVFDQYGRIIQLGSPNRVFTAQQRRAIALRDGECSVPGCHVPAAWCEIHHVDPAANDGETHTDNGLLLCWFHHRTLDTSGWEFRMVAGVPEVKYPPWLDPTGTWYHTSGSRTRQLDTREPVPV